MIGTAIALLQASQKKQNNRGRQFITTKNRSSMHNNYNNRLAQWYWQ